MRVKSPRWGQLRTDDILTDDVTLGASWTRIGSYSVPAGLAVELGFGKAAGQDNARGRLYFDIVDDAAGAEDGVVRFEARGPQGRPIQIITDQISTVAGRSGDADTRAAQLPWPETGVIVPEDWTIEMWMDGDASGDVVDVSACTLLMDVIFYTLVK